MDKITYEKSGVNIDTADATKREMAKYVNSNKECSTKWALSLRCMTSNSPK